GAQLDLEGAAGTGRLDVVKRYLGKNGTLRNGATQRQLETGFLWACEYGQRDVVDFLARTGVDLAAQRDGETGLHWASYGGHAEIVRLLLERKAPLDVKDRRYGAPPLGWALHGWCYPPPEAKDARHVEVVKLLVAYGADAFTTIPKLDASQ